MMSGLAALGAVLSTLGAPGLSSLKRPADALLVRHDTDCGYTYNGVAYSHILDSVADALDGMGRTRCTVASPYSRLVGKKAYGSPVCINQEYALATISSRIGFSGDRIRRNVRAKKKIWERVIETASPKVIIGIAPGPELCWAANDLGIPVYDIQHGAINDGHAYYKKILREGPAKYVPTGFLCWDETAARTLDWVSARGGEVYIVGNPWFSRFIKRKGGDRLVDDAMSRNTLSSTGKKNILVTLQWGLREFFGDPNYYEILPPALIQAIKTSEDKYNWLLRLHPVQVRGDAKGHVISFLQDTFGGSSRVRWMEPTAQPLPQLLSRCDLHITDCGSTTIEAAWYGIPTALLNSRYGVGEVLEEYFLLERSVGLATCVPQEPLPILRWIDSHERTERSTWIDGDLYAVLHDIVPT